MYSLKNPIMKFKRHSNVFTNSTGSVTFNPETKEAYSYTWWKFVAIVEGLVIFNNYRYSQSTSKHQYAVKHIMNELKININIEIPLPKGINSTSLSDLIIEAEESLCDSFLSEQLKKQERYERVKARKLAQKAVTRLEIVKSV